MRVYVGKKEFHYLYRNWTCALRFSINHDLAPNYTPEYADSSVKALLEAHNKRVQENGFTHLELADLEVLLFYAQMNYEDRVPVSNDLGLTFPEVVALFERRTGLIWSYTYCHFLPKQEEDFVKCWIKLVEEKFF